MQIVDMIVPVGIAMGVISIVIAWSVWSRLYVAVTSKNKMEQGGYRRFVVKMAVLGIWNAVGWSLIGIGMVESPSSGSSLVSGYTFPTTFCFGAGVGTWLLWLLSMIVRLRAKLRSK